MECIVKAIKVKVFVLSITNKAMQVYVFRKIFADLTPGIAVAIATSEKNAKKQLVKIFKEDRELEAKRDKMIEGLYDQYGYDVVMTPRLKTLSGKSYEEWVNQHPSPRNTLGAWRGNVDAFRKELDSVKPEVYPIEKLALYIGGGS